jgi:hypothetical protein
MIQTLEEFLYRVWIFLLELDGVWAAVVMGKTLWVIQARQRLATNERGQWHVVKFVEMITTRPLTLY